MKIEKIRKINGKLKFPNFDNYVYFEDVKLLVEDRCKPLFYAAFGSVLEKPKFIEESYFFNLFTNKIRLTPEANDIDILVVCSDNKMSQDIEIPLKIENYENDGYSCGWITEQYPGKFHIIIASYKNVKKAIKEKDIDIKKILIDSMFLEGNQSKYEELTNDLKNVKLKL